MTGLKRALAFCFMLSLLAACCGVASFAKGSDLPDGFCIGDENGISVTNENGYFMNVDHMMPGDVFTRTLTLQNLEQGEPPYTLRMTAEPLETTGPVDWLDNLYLLLTLDGEEIYAGRLRGDGADTKTMKGNGADLLYEGLALGTFKPGDSAVLRAAVTVDAGHLSTADLTPVSAAKVRWNFEAVKDVEAPPPKTGDIVKYSLYALLFLLMVLCVVFHYRYRKLRGNC